MTTVDADLGRLSHVKRPMNAFMLWSQAKRRKISSADPCLHNSHISKLLGEEWKSLPTKEKDPFIKESKSLMEKHKKDHPSYHYKPRQNKLSKALKEFSSQYSSHYDRSGGCSSGIGSPTTISALGNESRGHAVLCNPNQGYQQPNVLHEYIREHRGGHFYAIAKQYCRRSSGAACTCSKGRMSGSRMTHQRYFAYHQELSCYENCRSRSPSAFREPNQGHCHWTPYSHPAKCGWSVPRLVRDKYDGCRRELSDSDENGAESAEYTTEAREDSKPRDASGRTAPF